MPRPGDGPLGPPTSASAWRGEAAELDQDVHAVIELFHPADLALGIEREYVDYGKCDPFARRRERPERPILDAGADELKLPIRPLRQTAATSGSDTSTRLSRSGWWRSIVESSGWPALLVWVVMRSSQGAAAGICCL